MSYLMALFVLTVIGTAILGKTKSTLATTFIMALILLAIIL